MDLEAKECRAAGHKGLEEFLRRGEVAWVVGAEKKWEVGKAEGRREEALARYGAVGHKLGLYRVSLPFSRISCLGSAIRFEDAEAIPAFMQNAEDVIGRDFDVPQLAVVVVILNAHRIGMR